MNGEVSWPIVRWVPELRTYRIQGLPAHDSPWIESANKFLNTVELRGLSQHTVRAYGFDLICLHRWCFYSQKQWDDLKQADLFDFIEYQRKTNAHAKSINRRLSVCRMYYCFRTGHDLPGGPGAFNRAPSHYRVRVDPHLGLFLRRPSSGPKLWVKETRKLIEPLTPIQVRLFLEQFTRYRDLAIVYLMLLCGLRSCEVLSLMIKDVQSLERSFRVLGKGKKERLLPLPGQLVMLLDRYVQTERPKLCPSPNVFVVLQGRRRGEPMTPAGLRSLFRHRRKKPDLSTAHPHKFRHTFGVTMARSQVSLPVLQKMMGHADQQTTLQYIYLSLEDVTAEYDRAIERIQKQYALSNA